MCVRTAATIIKVTAVITTAPESRRKADGNCSFISGSGTGKNKENQKRS
jgi:hypothetical protein